MSAACIGFVVKTFPKLSETFILGEILGLERMGLALEIFALQRPGETLHHGEVDKVRARIRYLSDNLLSGTSHLVKDHLGRKNILVSGVDISDVINRRVRDEIKWKSVLGNI